MLPAIGIGLVAGGLLAAFGDRKRSGTGMLAGALTGAIVALVVWLWLHG